VVREVSCREARDALGRRRLVDVRTPWEWDLVHVPGSERLDEALLAALTALPRDTPLAFLCHHGIRSAGAAAHFARLGFTDLWNVAGGIEAWAEELDPTLPRY
jgi:monothiol glutaredoxin